MLARHEEQQGSSMWKGSLEGPAAGPPSCVALGTLWERGRCLLESLSIGTVSSPEVIFGFFTISLLETGPQLVNWQVSLDSSGPTSSFWKLRLGEGRDLASAASTQRLQTSLASQALLGHVPCRRLLSFLTTSGLS